MVAGQASAQTALPGYLSEFERQASYCNGVHTERYGGYFFSCEKDHNCKLKQQLEASDAIRKPSQSYLEKQGLQHNGARSEADKLEAARVAGRGIADFRACFSYFNRVIAGCLIHCLDSKTQETCIKECEAANSQACARIEACSETFNPTGIKP